MVVKSYLEISSISMIMGGSVKYVCSISRDYILTCKTSTVRAVVFMENLFLP